MALFLVPAANKTAMRNLQATVAAPVAPGKLTGLPAGTIAAARAATGGVGAWGTQAGKNDVNVGTWQGMRPGDWVLFYSQGHFPYAGQVLARERSSRVARRPWKADATGTWAYMYLLENVRRIDAPLSAVIAALDYGDRFRPQKFSRVPKFSSASPAELGQLVASLARQGAGLGEAIELALGNGDEAAIAAAIDSLPDELSNRALAEAIASRDSSAPPQTVRAMVKRIARDRKLAKDLKALYGGRCQCCDFTFKKRDGTPYAEAAHLRAISYREADLDVKDNLVVLCPNHHKMLDFGPLEIWFDEQKDQLLCRENGKTRSIVNKHVRKQVSGLSPVPAKRA